MFGLLLAGGLVACGDPERMREEEFCPAYAQAECSSVGRWCGVSTESATCAASRAGACQLRTMAQKTGRGPFSPVDAAACVAKLKSVHATATAPAQGLRDLEAICNRVYRGSLPVDAICDRSEQCQAGLTCDRYICRPVPSGQQCYQFAPPCKAGEYCGNFGCEPKGDVGASCIYDLGCREDLRCLDRSCVLRANIDEFCTQDRQCQLPVAFCHPHTKTCALGVTFAPELQSCDGFVGL